MRSRGCFLPSSVFRAGFHSSCACSGSVGMLKLLFWHSPELLPLFLRQKNAALQFYLFPPLSQPLPGPD